jgi:hypothetical protein
VVIPAVASSAVASSAVASSVAASSAVAHGLNSHRIAMALKLLNSMKLNSHSLITFRANTIRARKFRTITLGLGKLGVISLNGCRYRSGNHSSFHFEGSPKNKVQIGDAFLITHKQRFYSPRLPHKSPRFDHPKTTPNHSLFRNPPSKTPTKSPKSTPLHRQIFFSV